MTDISKFLIEIGIDQAAYNELVKKFKDIGLKEEDLKKKFLGLQETIKKGFIDSTVAVKLFNRELQRSITLLTMLKRVTGVGPGLAGRIDKSRKLLPTGARGLTALNVGQVGNVKGVGSVLAKRIAGQVAQDEATSKFFDRIEQDRARTMANAAKRLQANRKRSVAQRKTYTDMWGAWGKSQPSPFAGATYHGGPKMEIGSLRGQPTGYAGIYEDWRTANIGRGSAKGATISGAATGNEAAALEQALKGNLKNYDLINQAKKESVNTDKKALRLVSSKNEALDNEIFKIDDAAKARSKSLKAMDTQLQTQKKVVANAERNLQLLDDEVRGKNLLSGQGGGKDWTTAEKQAEDTSDRRKKAIQDVQRERTEQKRLEKQIRTNENTSKVIDLKQHKRSTAKLDSLDKLWAKNETVQHRIDKLIGSSYRKSVEFGDRQNAIMKQTVNNTLDRLDLSDAARGGVFNKAQVKAANKELNKINKNLDIYNKQLTKTHRGQGLLNSRFGSFSIIMSGLAATIFVAQNIIRGLGALAAPALEIERTWKKLATTFVGTREEMEAFFDVAKEINLSGIMKAGEAADQLIKFKKAGFGAKEAIAALRAQVEIIAKEQGPIDKLVERVKGAWRTILSPDTDPNAKAKNKEMNLRILQGIGTDLKGQEILSDRRKAEQIKFENIEVIFTHPKQKWGPIDGKWFNSLEEYNQYLIGRESGKSALTKFSGLTGRQVPSTLEFYEDQRRMQMQAFERMVPESTQNRIDPDTGAISYFKPQLEEFGKFLDDEEFKKNATARMVSGKKVYDKLGKMTVDYYHDQRILITAEEQKDAGLIGKANAEKLADNKRFNLDIQRQKAEFLKMNEGVQKKQAKLRSEYDVVTPGLKKIWEWESRERRLRATRRGKPRDPATLAIIDQSQLIKDHKRDVSAKIKIEKAYYKETKIMSDELFEDRKWNIVEESKLLTKKGLTANKALEIEIERYRQLTRERAAGEAVAIARGDTPTEGMKARIKELEATSTTVAQRWQQRWATMINGTKQSVDTFFFTFFQDESKSLIDSFSAMGNAFKSMIDKMASDLIASGLMRGLFGKMYAGDSNGFGLLGELFNIGAGSGAGYGTGSFNIGQSAGYKATGGPVSANNPYIVGEAGAELFIPGKSGNIVPNNKLSSGSNVQVVVNNNSSEKATVTESRGPDNMRRIMVTIGANDITTGGPMAKAMEQTYGVRRTGRNV